MSDVIAPIVADTDELSSGDAPGAGSAALGQPQEAPNGALTEKVELLDRDQNGGAPVRKMRSGASSAGSSTKPSLSSRLDNLKISTIRQHYYPEGGWGWVICACAFAINLLTHGLLLSYGILYQEVIKEFGEEYTEQA
ncbi:Monocarboxylate transporter 7, partial [Stegodyphus mimosarum]